MNRLIKNPFLHCLIIGLLVALFSQWIPQQTTIFLHHSEINARQKELSESINGRAVEFNRSAQLLAEQEILFLEAKKSGVSFLAYRCSLNSKEIKIEKKIKIINE